MAIKTETTEPKTPTSALMTKLQGQIRLMSAEMAAKTSAVNVPAIVMRGPRFFRTQDGTLMFEEVIDSTSKIGPRVATDQDKEDHREAMLLIMTEPTEPSIGLSHSAMPRKGKGSAEI